MTYFLGSGTSFSVSTKEAMNLHDKLPVGTYTVKFNQMSGSFYLEATEGFEIRGKIYGDTVKQSTRVLDTFLDRPASTGVMLTGEKGSGKTLLAKKISLDAADRGIPTFIINQPWAGEGFNGFMQMIEQPVIVIFDEFEKVYGRDEQDQLLTLFDGVYPSKKLFIITSNDKYRINEHMQNRPGRIFYRLDYKGLDAEFIREYCEDNLKNKTYIDSLCRLSVLFNEFNFDILKAVVEEMNRYDESPQDVIKILNAKPNQGEATTYTISLQIDGKPVTEEELDDENWRGNPLAQELSIARLNPESDDENDEPYYLFAKFKPTDLQSIDPNTGRFHFANEKGEKLTLAKYKKEEYNYDAF